MRSELRWRFFFIVAVTVISIFLILPTAKYFSFISFNPRPAEEQAALDWDETTDEMREKSRLIGGNLVSRFQCQGTATFVIHTRGGTPVSGPRLAGVRIYCQGDVHYLASAGR